MESDTIKQHFRPEEAQFVDQAQGLVNQVVNEYRPVLSNFLNPRQRYILQTLVNRQADIKVTFHGGFDQAENQRALIYPDYYAVQLDDFQVTLLEIKYAEQFETLRHSSILGALIHAGLKRESFGDLIHADQRWQLAISKPLVAFLQLELTRIGHVKIQFEVIPLAKQLPNSLDGELKDLLISALRLDILVANGYNIPRSQAKELIERGQVRVNWVTREQPDLQVGINDLISVRRHGRLIIDAVNGQTKKDKWRLSLRIIRK
ncbi:hypothetical protein IV73_GL000212 [Weissella kandleri]|uniref:RNA-binding S4 domain-containing protein n=1 Tax=Weissella kandleri TaxID=1616 RepID=A0A0R2JK97_9LACO|nr:YlmH/Sll1252 family protein [Weissella kandleri]KRN75717.1 hypothetical protein IV73_GL000212 [Weissella kandleri]